MLQRTKMFASISGTDMQQVAMASCNWFGGQDMILHTTQWRASERINKLCKRNWLSDLSEYFESQSLWLGRKNICTFKPQASATSMAPSDWASLLRNAIFSITTSNFQRCQGQTSQLEEICVVFPCTHCLRVWVSRSKPLSTKVGLIKLSQSHLQLHHLHNHLRVWWGHSGLTLKILSNSAGLTPPSEWTSWDLAASTAAA